MQHSKSSDDEARTTFRNELTACLALTAPSGMTEESRRDWLAVAWQTLKEIPPDILVIGARAARLKCDHPSKIVPTIIAETEEMRRWRRESRMASSCLQITAQPRKRHVMDRRGEAMTQEDTDELNRILESLGATVRYRPDGSRQSVTA